MNRLLISILVLTIFISCNEEEDNRSVVGEWNIKSYRYKVLDGKTEVTDQFSMNVGTITFRENGSGELKMTIPVTSLPMNANLSWVENPETLQIIIDYKDGKFPRTYSPSYRGNYTLLTRKTREIVLEKPSDVTIEILLER